MNHLAERNPLVSVIVPTHNRPDKLPQALKSILDQTCQSFEIIVVNDAGQDVGEVVASLNSSAKITLLTHSRNKGAPGARNTGLQVAKGKYIAYLDDDDTFLPDHLRTLSSFLESSEYSVAYTDAYRAYQVFENGRYTIAKREVPYSRDFDPDQLLVWNIAPVNCFAHARACLDDIGLFDETLAPIEDWDFWIRLSLKYPFAHIKKTTCEVSWRLDGTSLTSARRAQFIRMTRLLYEKHRAFVQDKPDVQLAQQNFLSYLDEIYSDELRIQNLVESLFSEKKDNEPLVRDLLNLILTMREKNLEDHATISYQQQRIAELDSFVAQMRANPMFRLYHWLKYLGRK